MTALQYVFSSVPYTSVTLYLEKLFYIHLYRMPSYDINITYIGVEKTERIS